MSACFRGKLLVDPAQRQQGLGTAGEAVAAGSGGPRFAPDRQHDVPGVLAPRVGQGRERGVEQLDARERPQRFIPRGEETLADGFIFQHQVLPGTALEIDRAFGQLLHARVEGDCRCTAFAALARELLERHPAAGGRCAQYAGDDEKAGQQGQAE
ncbi:hypothetical protein [Thauera humireducens]|uniref:hypothetical protein n=1 Tax=Thauera humireducens TaxID=1134435 RepID=UPI00311E6159